MGDWKSVNHSKYLLQDHLILVCKYRKRLLSGNNISSDIKKLSIDICLRHDVMIRYMETDKDHIHYMIETEPTVRLSDFVRTLKSYTMSLNSCCAFGLHSLSVLVLVPLNSLRSLSGNYYTTFHIWKKYPNYLSKCFWKEKTFWTDGYFICSVGNVSEETLRKYIENQG